MKNKLMFFILISLMFFQLGQNPALANDIEPIFLLGKNNQAEVMDINGKILSSLTLMNGPQKVITNICGSKLIFCKDKKQWSISLLNNELNTIKKRLTENSQLISYAINQNHSQFWAISHRNEKDENDELIQVDLKTLECNRISLDSPGIGIALSPNEAYLIITTRGLNPLYGNLLILKTDSFKIAGIFDINKNPADLHFFINQNILMISSYGYHPALKKIDKEIIQTDASIPGGADYIDLTTLKQSPSIPLGNICGKFIEKNGRVYALVSNDKNGRVIELNPSGISTEFSVNFIPRQIEVNLQRSEIYVIGLKNIAIVNQNNNQLIADFKFNWKIEQFVWHEDSPYGLVYHPTSRGILSILNLTDFRIEKNISLGRGYMVALKTLDYASSVSSGDISALLDAQDMITRSGNMLLVPSKKKAYIYNTFTQDVSIFDIENNQLKQRIGCTFLGDSAKLIMTPNQKFVLVMGEDKWRLINTETDQTELDLRIKWFDPFEKKITPSFYQTASGEQLIVSTGKKIYFVDLQTGKLNKKMASKTKNALISW